MILPTTNRLHNITGLTPCTNSVLNALYQAGAASGFIEISLIGLANLAGVCRRTAVNASEILTGLGIVKKISQRIGEKENAVNRYWIDGDKYLELRQSMNSDHLHRIANGERKRAWFTSVGTLISRVKKVVKDTAGKSARALKNKGLSGLGGGSASNAQNNGCSGSYVKDIKEKEGNTVDKSLGKPPKWGKYDLTLEARDITRLGVTPDLANRYLKRCNKKGFRPTIGTLVRLIGQAKLIPIHIEYVFMEMDEYGLTGWQAQYSAWQKNVAWKSFNGVRPVAWLSSWSGIEAKGRELGLYPEDYRGNHIAFKQSVIQAAQLTDQEKAIAKADYGIPAWQLE